MTGSSERRGGDSGADGAGGVTSGPAPGTHRRSDDRAPQRDGVLARIRPELGRYFGGGVLAGALSFVLGYVLLLVLMFVEGSTRNVGTEADIPFAAHRVVGWLYYGAHSVEVTLDLSAGPLSRRQSLNILESASGGLETVPKLAFYAVPPVALVVGGIALATFLGRRIDVRRPREGALLGAGVVVGYALLAVGGAATSLFVESGQIRENIVTINYSVQPDISTTVTMMALAYPLAFGALGGAIAVYVGRRGRR